MVLKEKKLVYFNEYPFKKCTKYFCIFLCFRTFSAQRNPPFNIEQIVDLYDNISDMIWVGLLSSGLIALQILGKILVRMNVLHYRHFYAFTVFYALPNTPSPTLNFSSFFLLNSFCFPSPFFYLSYFPSILHFLPIFCLPPHHFFFHIFPESEYICGSGLLCPKFRLLSNQLHLFSELSFKCETYFFVVLCLKITETAT